jgi:hypothetical protein
MALLKFLAATVTINENADVLARFLKAGRHHAVVGPAVEMQHNVAAHRDVAGCAGCLHNEAVLATASIAILWT